MEKINEDNHNMYNILSEDDYDITVEDKGITLNGFIHEKDMMETFTIRNPKAVKADKSLMGKFGEDERHSIWINKDTGNDTKLLLMCDSYINSFIVEDFAESFQKYGLCGAIIPKTWIRLLSCIILILLYMNVQNVLTEVMQLLNLLIR